MATVQEPEVKRAYKVIGTRPIRHDGVDKVTGRAVYANDLQLAVLAHGKIVRSPHAHAEIESIDTTEAAHMPGVLAVVTSADLPEQESTVTHLGEGSANLAHLSENVLARKKVLYKGHAVAAVVALSPHQAEEAAAKIQVRYRPLPAVTWVLDAMKEDAPLLHAELRTSTMGQKGDRPSNTSAHLIFEQGDLEKGLSEADVIIEREYRTATVHQGYIEPHACTAFWNHDGRVKVWTSTQGSFTCRDQVATLLKLPVSWVTVVPCEIGGGFGGKINVYLEPVAALLSKKCGRPVRLAMTRAECFECTGPTSGSFIRVKLGATKDGRFVAGAAWMAYDAGAYPSEIINMGSLCIFACYDIPNTRVDGFDVCVNKPRSAPYRAPGSTNACFAIESVVDEVARELGMDPIDLRLKNAAREGTRRSDGVKYPRIGLVETLEKAKQHPHYTAPLGGPNRGRGVACGYWFNIGLKSVVTASVHADGTVTLVEGSTDIGGTRTSIAMQLAETLGIPAEDVRPQVVDTDSVGYTDVTGGSRTTFATGYAAYESALDIRRQLIERAAILWECDPEEVAYADGGVRRGETFLSFKEIVAKASTTGGPIVGNGAVDPKGVGGAFATHIVDVEADPETGKVTILRYTAVQDVGTAIHPSYVEGQIHGGVAQGIGWALNEEYWYDNEGRMRNASYLDYRMPTCFDLPMIEAVWIEVPNPGHPYGVRGVGEVPICPPPAAIADAIHQAVGVRMRELPMNPPRVWAELAKKG